MKRVGIGGAQIFNVDVGIPAGSAPFMGEKWRAALDSQPPAARAPVLESASALAGGGLVVRLAAESVEELVRSLRSRLAGIPALLGDDPWARRA